MSLSHVKKTYERLGKDDPLYAVLSDKRYQHNRWDEEEFFQTGEQEIAELLAHVQHLGVTLEMDNALDFGCGVGRLSQALAERFVHVTGVDISESMVQRARRFNRHGDRVTYVANAAGDLQLFDDDQFDFIYSCITLQHIPPEHGSNYIREFIRILRPGGLAVFQVPNGKPYRADSFAAWSYTFRRRYLRRFLKRLRGRPPVEIHYIAKANVEHLIQECGGRIVEALPIGRERHPEKNYRYCATKAA